MTTRPQRRLIGERGPELVLPLHKAPEVLSKLGGGRGGGFPAFNVSIGSVAPGLLDMPRHVLARFFGDAMASALQRRGDTRRSVKGAVSGGL